MSPEAQRIAIAEACGWTECDLQGDMCGFDPDDGNYGILPDYLNDLDEIHEAEKVLTDKQYRLWGDILLSMFEPGCRPLSATAAQRAEAFLRTLDLWK